MLPVLHRHLAFPFIEMLRREPISRCFSVLSKSQWYTRDELKALQWKKLKRLIDHCYRNVPYYRKCFTALGLTPDDVKDFRDFENLPFLTKDIIMANQNELVDRSFRGKVEHCHSGGTQGTPLWVLRDAMCSAYARAALFRGLSWHGIKKGDKQIRVWGVPLVPRSARKENRKDFYLNRKRVSAFDIRRDNVLEYVRIMKCFKPKYLYGYTSGVYRLCQVMRQENVPGDALNVKYAITTAESLSEHQRRFIESFLNCRVLDEYGCGEMGPIAFECPEGAMHINMENIFVEFVEGGGYNQDNAEIVLTNLNNFSMPLLRYKIYDTGRGEKSECACGRKLDVMDFNAGRVVSTLVATDGHFVAGNIFRYLAFDFIEKYGAIRDFRVVQKERARLEITLSKDDNFSSKLLERFTRRVREILGSDMAIEYIYRDEIPLERSGKRLYVFSELEEFQKRN